MRGAFIRNLAITLAYAVTGVLALMLAPASGVITPIFPPAGIALIAVLAFGRSAYPWVWMGSFLLNVVSYHGPWFDTLLVGAVIASGALLQAIAGGKLVRLRVQDVLGTLNSLDAIWLLAVGGPVACLINASVSTLFLLRHGDISALQWPSLWWTWWVGDAIGVLIVSPLMLVLWPGHPWRRFMWPVLGLLALALGSTGWMVTRVAQEQAHRAEDQFLQRSKRVQSALTQSLEGYEQYVHLVARFIETSPKQDSKSFLGFVEGLYGTYSGIKGLSWCPLIRSDQRREFERSVSAVAGRAVTITEWTSSAGPQPAGAREQYFPVLYIEPRSGNEAAFGFDINSEPARNATLQAALTDDQAHVTAPIALVQNAGQSSALIVKSVKDSHGKVVGVVTGVFSVQAMVSPAAELARKLGLTLYLVDLNATGQRELANTEHERAMDAPAYLTQSRRWTWAGRAYEVRMRPAPEFMTSIDSMGAWSLFATGLFLASLLQGLLLSIGIHRQSR